MDGHVNPLEVVKARKLLVSVTILLSFQILPLEAPPIFPGMTSRKFVGTLSPMNLTLKHPNAFSPLAETASGPSGVDSAGTVPVAHVVSSLQVLSGAGTESPWSLGKYDIPVNHRSGVYVDLGKTFNYRGTSYRIANGQCPVWGKSIKTYQPTTDPKKYPNNFLAELPLKSGRPLEGGFSWPAMGAISSRDVQHIKSVYEGYYKKYPKLKEPYKSMIEAARDDIDWCAIAAYGYEPKGTHAFRYNWAYDGASRECYVLYIGMQQLRPAICSKGNEPAKSWYCFDPVKDQKKPLITWGTSSIRPDWKEKCPRFPIRDSQFGQWTGHECIPMAPVESKMVEGANECGILVFDRSPSDQPSKPYNPPTWKDPRGAVKEALDGAVSSDRPHTSGIGVNWATYYTDGTCHLHNSTPDCLIPLKAGFAYTSVGTFDAALAINPPCPPDATGFRGSCSCKTGRRTITKCVTDTWVTEEEKCVCTPDDPGYEEEEDGPKRGGINPWLIAGPIIGVALLALCGGAGYYFVRKRRKDPRDSMAEASGVLGEGDERGKKKRDLSDMMQEADPSFWGEGRRESDATQVMIETTY